MAEYLQYGIYRQKSCKLNRDIYVEKGKRKAIRLKSRYQQAVLSPKALRENPFLPFPACGGSRCSLTCGRVTQISASDFPMAFSSLCVFPLGVSYKDTCHRV
ncbi:unnamed protein product [Nyctereutes procyonoides]|uniref:(raccoon dog) hypothetical protein n=1 Tax=Nyctereutes procyonoides TaxID=34880 RepID=A0A811YF39_NYCPR|nr:unnamed protein product [Nyctereutes procyonoides]